MASGDGLVIGICSVAGSCLEQLIYFFKPSPVSSTKERVRAKAYSGNGISWCASSMVSSMGHGERVVDNFSPPGRTDWSHRQLAAVAIY